MPLHHQDGRGRLRPALTALVAIAVAVLAAVAVAPAPAVAGPPPALTRAAAAVPLAASPAPSVGEVRVVFGEPGVPRVRSEVVRLLRRTPPGQVVRGVTWTFASRPLADELVRASRRGVTVRVLAGSASCGSGSFRSLRQRLRAPSRARCARASARGRDRFDGRRTNLHQKSWTFSVADGARWVSVVTSANATAVADRSQWNDAVVVRGGRDLHARLTDLFAAQWRDRPVRNPYREVRVGGGTVLAAGPWSSPRMADPVLRRLRTVPAPGARIVVAHSNWQDPRGVRIARALAAKARAGASVRVLTSRPHGSRVRSVLAGAGVRQRSAFVSPSRYSHLKFVAAAWPEGGGEASRVWTGSENLWSASRGHDELVLGLPDPAVHRAYEAFFDRLWRR